MLDGWECRPVVTGQLDRSGKKDHLLWVTSDLSLFGEPHQGIVTGKQGQGIHSDFWNQPLALLWPRQKVESHTI